MVKVLYPRPGLSQSRGAGRPVTVLLTLHLVNLSPSGTRLPLGPGPPAALLSGARRLCSLLQATLLSSAPSCLPRSRSMTRIRGPIAVASG